MLGILRFLGKCRIYVKIGEILGGKSCQGKLPQNRAEYYVNRLLSITHLVLCQLLYVVFLAEFCLLVFSF